MRACEVFEPVIALYACNVEEIFRAGAWTPKAVGIGE